MLPGRGLDMTTIQLLALTKAILYQVAVLIGLIAGLAGCSFLFRNPN